MTNIGILDPSGKNKNPLNDQEYSETYKKLAKTWSKFPAYENVNDTLKIINSNQIILITSGTGSGKTVLIPKYVLHNYDYKGHILVSLPKQIIAQSAAEYAALTLDVNLGEQVGYKYKGSDEKYIGKNPNLLYILAIICVNCVLPTPGGPTITVCNISTFLSSKFCK